jgi:FkbM family methyltransferase
LEVFDPIVRARAAATPGFFFLQVGANDGVRYDPLRPIVLEYHVRGLCVEPLPDMFARLKQNYAAESQLLFEQAAIAPAPGSMTLCRFRADAPVEDYLHGMATFDCAKLRKLSRERNIEQFVEEVSVPTITVEQLLHKHKIEHVSLLQVDTEGFDHHIVRMALAAGLRPDIIHYEYVHMSNADRKGVLELLRQNGYAWVHERNDVLAMRQREVAQ